jgi:nitrate reductase cytochrome c-type subunit
MRRKIRKGLGKIKGTTLFTLTIVVALMTSFIYVQFEIFYKIPQKVDEISDQGVIGYWGNVPDLKAEKGMYSRLNEGTPLKVKKRAMVRRSLDGMKENRAYHGAPPSIPHEIKTSMEEKTGSCLYCHENGGFTPHFSAFAPITPHPEMKSCRQCHVPQLTNSLFKNTDWPKTRPDTSKGRIHLKGGPPTIPHSLQMRENCLSCHSGPSAVKAIKVSHPERASCRQCHVPAQTSLVFRRKI